ncbi:MAG: hypothetical protein ACLP59_31460 [Bryobacteraceae bacterium]
MSQRGALLFRITANNKRDRYSWLLAGLALATVILIEARQRHSSPNSALLFLAAFYLAMFLLQRRVSVYENGIHFPANSSGARGRFIAWTQVARFHWDGDMLTIVPSDSVRAGADIGRALVGGAVRVPTNKRAQMENLLARKASAVENTGQ